jgi:hypothetical protein
MLDCSIDFALIQIETTHYTEMNDEVFDNNMNVCHITRNVIGPMPFSLFRGRCDSMAYV